MNLKYSPVVWNPNASHKANVLPDTTMSVADENTLIVDGVDYEFAPTDVAWDDPATATDGVILDASRDTNGMLCLVVRRYYTGTRPSWDDGDWHTLAAGEKA